MDGSPVPEDNIFHGRIISSRNVFHKDIQPVDVKAPPSASYILWSFLCSEFHFLHFAPPVKDLGSCLPLLPVGCRMPFRHPTRSDAFWHPIFIYIKLVQCLHKDVILLKNWSCKNMSKDINNRIWEVVNQRISSRDINSANNNSLIPSNKRC